MCAIICPFYHAMGSRLMKKKIFTNNIQICWEKNTKKNSKLFLRGRTIINHPRHIKCFCCLGISIDYIKSKYLVCAETKKSIEKFSGILVDLKNLILRAHITIISTISLFIDSICNLLYILFFQCTFILVWNFEHKSLWVQRWFVNVWL